MNRFDILLNLLISVLVSSTQVGMSSPMVSTYLMWEDLNTLAEFPYTHQR